MNISFFNLRFDLFSIIVKEVNQIKNNVVRVVKGPSRLKIKRNEKEKNLNQSLHKILNLEP